MGSCTSSLPIKHTHISKIGDTFETKEQLTDALRHYGLESCQLLVAIDFTKSNTYQGNRTFEGKSLHFLPPPVYEDVFEVPSKRNERTLSFEKHELANSQHIMKTLNPYQYVLSVAGNQLESFDDDGNIPTCIFGHTRNDIHDPYVKEIYSDEKTRTNYKISGVIDAYESAVHNNTLSGPTRFTPVLEWAIRKVKETKNAYHILIIIGDGCIEDKHDTKHILAKAGNEVPLSVIFVGVGDGSNPEDSHDKWKNMRDVDDNPHGTIDNWQSVYLANIQQDLNKSPHPDTDLSLQMFMEIPFQYKYFKLNNLIHN
jgi:E3 ubiquitin-protein ligase RGLG